MNGEQGWRCKSCCQQIRESVNYWCSNKQCFFRKIVGTNIVCSTCFNTSGLMLKWSRDRDFTFNKTQSLLSIIKEHIDTELKRYSESRTKHQTLNCKQIKIDREIREYLNNV